MNAETLRLLAQQERTNDMKLDIDEVRKHLKEQKELWACIRLITEADYGCEALPEGSPMMDREVLITTEAEVISEVPDDSLIREGLDEGDYVTVQQKELFPIRGQKQV